MQWQTIDTVPKDGTPFLGFDPNHWECKIYVLIFCDEVRYGGELSLCSTKECYQEASGEGYFTWNPTHWMPLPEPPKD